MTLADYPPLNASLNALSTIFITAGWLFIRAERKRAHIVCMSVAIVTSSAFLTCYLIYHFSIRGSIRFTDHSIARPIYFTLLITHIMLAFTTVPLVLCTVVPALQARWMAHRRIARYTMPIWLYVSVTGVIVYFMLYQWFPSDEIKTKLAPTARPGAWQLSPSSAPEPAPAGPVSAPHA